MEDALLKEDPFQMDEAAKRLILVVDTDPGVRWAIERGLSRSGYDVRMVSNASDALRIAYDETVHGIILELLPEAGLGTELLTNLLATHSEPRIVCVSVESSPNLVIDCIRLGAADFIPKPFSLEDVRSALTRALAGEQEARTMRRPERAPKKESNPSQLIGISVAMQELRTTIQQVAQTDLNCLIRGESGTGKDMVAREIHRLSLRGDKPFVKVNCTALPEHLLESELFGYEKGAFTGAVASKPGRFELGNQGIVFLDEIGDMQLSLQAKLLQVIEHKEFLKLGGRKPIHVDVQIIAATNADLEQRTKEGQFRDDLYFRLNEVCIWVPPLEERKEDIALLVRHFIKKHGQFTEAKEMEISGEDLAALTEHAWPGNVRELESTIKRWLALGKKELPLARSGRSIGRIQPMVPPPVSFTRVPSNILSDEHMSIDPMDATNQTNGDGADISSFEPEPSEEELIAEALTRHNWNRRQAAKDLDMSYQTLRRRIEKYGLKEKKDE